MRSGARPVSRPSRSMLTVPRAYRSNSATARPIVAGSTSSVWGGSARRRKPKRRVAGLVVVAVELRRIAIGHPLGEAEGVPLRRRRLGHELVPVVGVGREDAPVAHDERHPGRMKVIFEKLEGPAQVALPAVGVPGEDQVEGARPWPGASISFMVARAPDRRAALGDLEHEAGVDEAVALDEAILLLALAGRAVAVVLAGGGLADPAGDARGHGCRRASAAGASRRGVLLESGHPGHLCSAVKALPAHLLGAIGIAGVKRLDVPGEGGDEWVGGRSLRSDRTCVTEPPP